LFLLVCCFASNMIFELVKSLLEGRREIKRNFCAALEYTVYLNVHRKYLE
jgi:hypothetical protein